VIPQADLRLTQELLQSFCSPRWIIQWQKAFQSQHGTNQRAFYDRIYSLRVTLWYLVSQTLNFDHTLSGVITNIRDGGGDRLGRKGRKKLSQRVISKKTNAYSQARSRLPLELLQAALARIQDQILKLVGLNNRSGTKPRPEQRVRQIVDGSTVPILVNPELGLIYPPARNQHGRSDWCLVRIVVGFCARCGAVLSTNDGPTSKSEQVLFWEMIQRAKAFVIWVGDRNFGVWSVAAQAVRFKQDVLVRLTQSRAKRLGHHRRRLRSGEECALKWTPSRSDKLPPGAQREPIQGRLIYVRIKRPNKSIDLWLFTTLEAADYPLALLVQWYGQRWQAELNFRWLKRQLRLGQLQVATPAMARKEIHAGWLAFNLVRALQWSAGARPADTATTAVTLSFNDARRVIFERLKEWSLGQTVRSRKPRRWVRDLLSEVRLCKLPKRKKPRPNQIRKTRHHPQKFPTFTGSRAVANARLP
jgi:hypothetical protein